MNPEVESCVRGNVGWAKLPHAIKQLLGNSQKEYEKCVLTFSIKNQLRHRGNLVRQIKKDERKYYEDLLAYSRDHLMLYPYHLSDVIVKGLRVTPFQYYVSIIERIMEQEKSYDSLPNFTAADCLRLLGIGRNQYIELMNQCRAGRRLFRRKAIRDLLPQKPVSISIEPWYMVQVGYVTEDDVKIVTEPEKEVIDKVIDNGVQKAGDLAYDEVHSLYSKGLIYLDVPMDDMDYIVVPPLEGFVMNRVLGDYFETLLYKIFVSIDEHTSVGELASILQIDSLLVRHAVSLYCRLGFAHKKGLDLDFAEMHSSWSDKYTPTKGSIAPRTPTVEDQLLIELNAVLNESWQAPSEENSSGIDDMDSVLLTTPTPHGKRIAFLFDSTLTAFLMMGNLSSGLKNHAVTMFEVGKLPDEALDSLLVELEKISADDSEGEAQRYFEHALTLRTTILFLRRNQSMCDDLEPEDQSLGLDLIRCESLQSLDPATCTRLLSKNYSLLVSMAPLSKEVRPVRSCLPPHLGPAIPEVNSIWFKLFLYRITGQGPPSLLLTKGTRLKRLPHVLKGYDRLLVTTWSHDPGIIPTSSVIMSLNDALCHSAVLVQAYGTCGEAETFVIPFPFDENTDAAESKTSWLHHPGMVELSRHVDLAHNCGFVTMVNLHRRKGWSKVAASDDLSRPLWGRLLSLPEGVEEVSELKRVTPILTPDTPSTPSPINMPTNGIKEGCAAILEEELSLLDGLGQRTNVVVTNEEDLSEWTLLDCHFGIPLFDAGVNQKVSQRIVTGGLWRKSNLQTLVKSSRNLCLRLLDFISEFQDLPVAVEETMGSKKHLAPEVPHPTRNLVFYQGKLESWNGK